MLWVVSELTMPTWITLLAESGLIWVVAEHHSCMVFGMKNSKSVHWLQVISSRMIAF